MTPVPEPRRNGTRIGPYTLQQRLGVGRLSETYRAIRHNAPDWTPTLALKLAQPYVRQDPELREEWRKGFEASESLSHVNICQVFEVDQSADGEMFAGTEYVHGPDLKTIFHRQGVRPMPLVFVASLGAALVRAITYAEPVVTHGRLTPSKVLFDYRGEVKVTGFGLFAADSRANAIQAGPVVDSESPSLLSDLTAVGRMVQQAAGPPTSEVAGDIVGLRPELSELVRHTMGLGASSPDRLHEEWQQMAEKCRTANSDAAWMEGFIATFL